MTNQKPLCIYHHPCADGFAAAWVVRKFYGDGKVDFHGTQYGEPPPDVAGRQVVIVDFSYKRPVLEQMAAQAQSILVLDHHKTARDDLQGFPTVPAALIHEVYEPPLRGWLPDKGIAVHFDMERSGAVLAWDHFWTGFTRPNLLSHIQDRDLWLFKLEGTREIQASLFSFPFEFEIWDELMHSDLGWMRTEGAAIERKHLKDVVDLVAVTKRRTVILGYDVPIANLPYTLASDAGNQMAIGEPFAVTYFEKAGGRVYSLRSAPDGVDVSEIAKNFGGGGHKHAAGFTLDVDLDRMWR